MGTVDQKVLYKVISLFIKAVILFLSIWYIIEKIRIAGIAVDLNSYFHASAGFLLLLILLLMPVNWGLEARKWQLLIAPLEILSFSKSFKSILSGVTISIFSPNRVGEFAGRIFFLEKAEKIPATLKSFIGSAIQLIVTIVAGLCALFLYSKKGYGSINPASVFYNSKVKILLVGLMLIFILIILIYQTKNNISLKLKHYLHALLDTKRNTLASVTALSVLRYVVFSLQYYLALRIMNIQINPGVAMILIALTFLVTSAIPTFAVSEIAVRGATAVYFFGAVTENSSAVVAASLLVWIVNLAIPALIGGLFVWKLKFFKE